MKDTTWEEHQWSINFLLRLLLNRLLPFLFSPHSFLLIQQHELSYSEILVKSDRATRLLMVLLVVIVFALLFVSKII